MCFCGWGVVSVACWKKFLWGFVICKDFSRGVYPGSLVFAWFWSDLLLYFFDLLRSAFFRASHVLF